MACKEGNRKRSLSYVEVDWHSRATKDPRDDAIKIGIGMIFKYISN